VGRLEAEGFGVIPQTVYSWVAGIRSPRPPLARAIVRTSGGALTLNDVYGHREQTSRGGLDRGVFGRETRRLEGARCKST
jgi:hypothetical protein